MESKGSFRALFGDAAPCVGVIHLLPLPGSPRWQGDWNAVEDACRRDAAILAAAGADGVIVENYGDAPFLRDRVGPTTVAAMSLLTRAVREETRNAIPVGVNVLRNDALAALGVAAVARADFLRVNVHVGAMVTDQGVIEGQAAETMRERARLGASVLVFADVWVKHAVVLGADASIAGAAEDTFHRGLADALIVTGAGTGKPTSLDDLRAVRAAVPEAPLLAGSGVTCETLPEVLRVADGVIVGTALKEGARAGRPVSEAAARAFFAARRKT